MIGLLRDRRLGGPISRQVRNVQGYYQVPQGMGLEEWVFGGGSNQIAKMSLDFQELSFKDAKLLIENLLEKASGAIDHLLLEL